MYVLINQNCLVNLHRHLKAHETLFKITYHDTDRPRIVACGTFETKWNPSRKSLEQNFRAVEKDIQISNNGVENRL